MFSTLDQKFICACWARNFQTGFTLLELLITVFVVSIMMVIAIPTYQNYALRTQVGGEFGLIDPIRIRLSEYYHINGTWPANNAEAHLEPKEDYKGNWLESVEVTAVPSAGSIVMTYDASKLPTLAAGKTIIFYPVIYNGQIRWECDAGSMDNRYRPSRCKQ